MFLVVHKLPFLLLFFYTLFWNKRCINIIIHIPGKPFALVEELYMREDMFLNIDVTCLQYIPSNTDETKEIVRQKLKNIINLTQNK